MLGPLGLLTVASGGSEGRWSATAESTLGGSSGALGLRATVRAAHGSLYNEWRYGPADTADVVLVVLVRRDERALRRLLASLAGVRHIKHVLLVLSHAHYDDRIERLVKDVDYCRVLRLFYPHSVQLHRDRFPGPSPYDCGTSGADPSDCSPRDALRCEGKHHWWWTVKYTFERVRPAAAADAPVVFLDEAHEVTPDLLHVERLSRRALAQFPSVQLVALGRPPAHYMEPDVLALDVWRPAFAAGLVLNRTVWARMSPWASSYCMHDDTSWSHSLATVFARFPGGGAQALVAAEARVRCGGGSVPDGLFPRRLRVLQPWGGGLRGGLPRPHRVPLAPAGGWADLRDQLFCIDPLNPINIDSSEVGTNSSLDMN